MPERELRLNDGRPYHGTVKSRLACLRPGMETIDQSFRIPDGGGSLWWRCSRAAPKPCRSVPTKVHHRTKARLLRFGTTNERHPELRSRWPSQRRAVTQTPNFTHHELKSTSRDQSRSTRLGRGLNQSKQAANNPRTLFWLPQ